MVSSQVFCDQMPSMDHVMYCVVRLPIFVLVSLLCSSHPSSSFLILIKKVQLFSNLIGAGYPGVGTLSNVQDYAYVENVVHAFFKLEEKLTPGSFAAGQARTL